MSGAGADAVFSGLRVLVVEDEIVVAFLIEDMLRELGCAEIWHVQSVERALAMLSNRLPDIATLDVNLRSTTVFPIAERLATAGIPFLFATGYGGDVIPLNWRDRPLIKKPFELPQLELAMRSALAPRFRSS